MLPASPRRVRNLPFRTLQHDTGERLAASAVTANQASVNQIGACREDNLAKVRGGIDQLVGAASIGERKGPVDNGLDLAGLDVRPDLLRQFIDDRGLIRVC